MEKIKLIIPTMEYKEQVMKYKQDFIDNNDSMAGCSLLEKCDTYEEWIDFDNKLKKYYGDNCSPSTVFLAIRENDNKVIGMVDCRWALSEYTFNFGGHIGYSILPNERRKGYAKELLKLALLEYKKHGIYKVLVTCNKENIASSKTIIANDGILENEIENEKENKITQRYWINLK